MRISAALVLWAALGASSGCADGVDPRDAAAPPVDAGEATARDAEIRDAELRDATIDGAEIRDAAIDDATLPDAADAALPCTPSTHHADCDGDGFAALGAETSNACDTPDAPPSSCAGAPDAAWTLDDPADGEDCDDGDAAAVTIAQHWPDCDGDGLAPSSSAAVRSCGAPAKAPAACGPGEVGAWTTLGPGGASGDCDDHDPAVRTCA